MRFFKESILIVQTDLLIEFRKKSLFFSMIIFSLIIQVLLNIAFDARIDAMQQLASGMLWLPILLAAMIGFSKYGNAEIKNGILTGLLLSPIDRGAVFLGKLLGNLIFVLFVMAVSVPAFFLFLKHPAPESPGLFIAILLLGSWGFTSVGVFLSTIAKASSITEILIPIMLFPLTVPLIIALIRLTEIALYPTLDLGLMLWMTMLVSYNIIFTIIPLFLFDFILEG